MVIGSHPHVLQKMVWGKNITEGKDRIAVYSLGNFVSNQRKPGTDGGSMVRIEVTRDSDHYKISKAGFYLTWVYIPFINGRKKYFILPCSEFEIKPSFFSNYDDFLDMKKFVNNSRKLLFNQNTNITEYVFIENYWILGN